MHRWFNLLLIATLLAMLVDLDRAWGESNLIQVTLTPNVIELEAAPGETVHRKLTLSYDSGPPIVAVVDIFNFRQLPDGSYQLLPIEPLEAGQPWSSAAWVRPSMQRIQLAPGQETPVEFSVIVPREGEPGEYHSFLAIDFLGIAGGEGISVIPRLGARLYITVPGEHRREAGEVAVLFENLGPLGLPGPIRISVGLENIGTLHLDGTGKIKLQEKITGSTREVAFAPRRVLPNEKARLAATLSATGSLIPLYIYHGSFELTDPAIAAALPQDEFDLWLFDWWTLAAWVALIFGVWILWTSDKRRDVGRRLGRGIEAFLRG